MSDSKGVMTLVLEGMNPTVRAIMFSVLAFPVSLAISGMILQVNVGELLTKYADIKLAELSAKTPKPVEPPKPQFDDYMAMKAWICQHKQIGQPGFCK